LPVILTSREAAASIPEEQAELAQGLLPLDDLEQALPELLAGRSPAGLSPDPAPADAPTVIEATPPAADPSILEDLCRQPAISHGLQQVLFSAGPTVLAFCGPLGESEARLVAERVSQTWSNGGRKVQVQYLALPDIFDPMVLYTRPAAGCLLTLVALPAMRITDLRRQADFIVEQIVAHKLLATRESHPFDKPANGLSPQIPLQSLTSSLAVAWRPVRPLPPPVQTVLNHHLRRLARDHGYHLQYLQVESDLIHLVVDCPKDCPSGVVARLFKDGTEKAVEQQFGRPASLWKKGYYAAESREPMSVADLNVLLE
jgi:hypothetical protein